MKRSNSFSLLEIMIVIAIIASIAGVVITNLTATQDHAYRETTKTTILEVSKALDLYHVIHKKYPTTDEGLEKLLEAKQITKLPVDAWGEPIVYSYPGTHDKPYDLYSKGKDKQDGGEGPNADITNWED